MLDDGYVYVLMNPSMDNMVKIGKTTRNPEDRAKELSATTGVPTPFVVAYDCYFKNCSEAETFVHTYLETKGCRVTQNREFFEISIKDAINALMKAQEYFGEFKPENTNLEIDDLEYVENLQNQEPWEEMHNIAKNYYYGLGDQIQDYEEAMEYYLKAIKLGSVQAYGDVGNMYRYGYGVEKNIKTALKYYQNGIKKGWIECYALIAMAYNELYQMYSEKWHDYIMESDQDIDICYDQAEKLYGKKSQNYWSNMFKCWNKYFELSNNVDPVCGILYLRSVPAPEPLVIDKLIPIKDDILRCLLYPIDIENITKIRSELDKEIEYVKSVLS